MLYAIWLWRKQVIKSCFSYCWYQEQSKGHNPLWLCQSQKDTSMYTWITWIHVCVTSVTCPREPRGKPRKAVETYGRLCPNKSQNPMYIDTPLIWGHRCTHILLRLKAYPQRAAILSRGHGLHLLCETCAHVRAGCLFTNYAYHSKHDFISRQPGQNFPKISQHMSGHCGLP